MRSQSCHGYTAIKRQSWVLIVPWLLALSASAEAYHAVKPLVQTFDIANVSKANVVLDIQSRKGLPIYKLQCHSAGFTSDPDFDYSGDFECRLSSIGCRDRYSTLLTEDNDRSRDWESRGRFFGVDLRDSCARIRQFGAVRSFELRGTVLTLQITDPTFTSDGKLHSLKLTVKVDPNSNARRFARRFCCPSHPEKMQKTERSWLSFRRAERKWLRRNL
jgi:hypothetical protein